MSQQISNSIMEESYLSQMPKLKSFAIAYKTANNNEERAKIDSHFELFIDTLRLTSEQEDRLYNFYNTSRIAFFCNTKQPSVLHTPKPEVFLGYSALVRKTSRLHFKSKLDRAQESDVLDIIKSGAEK